jgi:IS4 transposase
MNSGRPVLAQMLDLLPMHEFHRCVQRYRGNFHCRRFTCYDQFLTLAFAQLTHRESLRDIETCLRAKGEKLYHAGLRARVARNTLAKANEKRDWRIWADLAQAHIVRARRLYAQESFGVELKQTAYAFDSTTIDLCLRLFPWAHFRRRKGAVKLHTLLDLRGSIPCFVLLTHGKITDVCSLDALPLEPGAFYVFDRGYTDFARLYRFVLASAFFVTRAKRGLDFRCVESRLVDKKTGLRCDQTLRLKGPLTSRRCPALLRRIAFLDPETGRRFVFLTNHFTLDALTIAQLYHARWKIELFFKWIKQYLHIKAFYGTSENAVKTQVWVALCVYLLVAILKKELRLDRSLGDILQILSLSLFDKTPVLQLLSRSATAVSSSDARKQLSLFTS